MLFIICYIILITLKSQLKLYFRALSGMNKTMSTVVEKVDGMDKKLDKLNEDVGGLQETAAAPDTPQQSKIPKALCVSYYCSIVLKY